MMSTKPIILPWKGVLPTIDPTAFVAPQVTITGDVHIGAESSIWFGTVIRGDVMPIRIGKRTNIQDLSLLHATYQKFETHIGDDVVGGHRITIHGCTIGNRCLLGMGSIILDGAVIGDDVMVAAGALVPPGMKVPSGVMVMGSPAKVKRELTEQERSFLKQAAQSYVDYSREYMKIVASS
jgi:carbonic anhydrase/acetyltransferase-like protein (isoleucine patch superfamily)